MVHQREVGEYYSELGSCLMQADERLHNSGLIGAIAELFEKTPDATIGIAPPFLGKGSYSWPSVSVISPGFQNGGNSQNLQLVFESQQYPDRSPQVEVYGWQMSQSENGDFLILG